MRKPIAIDSFTCAPVALWRDSWLLLTAGSADDYNCMTVAWGSIGCMWGRPFAQIVVRPSRHTFAFLEKQSEWTLCAFDEDAREDLKLLGSLSGRDGDKLARTALSPCPASRVAPPIYDEAILAIECRSLYHQDMDPAAFGEAFIHDCYPGATDHHRIWYGEILAISGEACFASA